MEFACLRSGSIVSSLSYCRSKGPKFKFQLCHITFMENALIKLIESDHDIISTIILPITLIQEGQLSFMKVYVHKY